MEKNNVYVPDSDIRSAVELCEELKKTLGGKKYIVESYGCQMNDHDSERLAGMLRLMGVEKADSTQNADIIIFNTCCVREHAEKRVFGNIGALKKIKDEKPDLIVAVCGCMMQQNEVADKLYKRFPFVNLVFGTNELHLFPQMLKSVLSGERVKKIRSMDGEIPEGLPAERLLHYSTNVIVMYGCNNFCSYCIVPYVRGRERSRRPIDIVNEVKSLADMGYKEITLIGQNVNSYKAETGEDFARLLEMVNEVDGIERIRFMTSHPKDLSDRLIDAMANVDKVCNHIHLPVQSGSDRILKVMNRRYTSGHYLDLVEKLKNKVKGVEITTDIIVGFPGETDEDFADTVELVKKVGYSAAYTFMYSKRAGTVAATMENQIPEEVKKQRLHALNEVCAAVIKENNPRYIGTTGEVLVEGVDRRDEPMAYGKLTCFKMVYFKGGEDLIGKTVMTKITDVQNNSLIGELIK